MARRKSQSRSTRSQALTKTFFVKHLNGLEERFDGKLQGLKKHLELKIEFARQDSKEHLQSVSEGSNQRMDKVEGRMGGLEGQLESVEAAVLETSRTAKKISADLGQVIEKVTDHDRQIAALKENRHLL